MSLPIRKIPAAVVLADLSNTQHAQAVVDLLDGYARDLLGGGRPLSADVRKRLIPGLQSQPGGRYFLAFRSETPVGVAICFTGFSTFQARPLLNIHDLAVRPESRGQGIGRKLLAAVEEEARRLGCCKLTLEVRADNPARRLYVDFGFDPGSPDSTAMSFLTKDLSR